MSAETAPIGLKALTLALMDKNLTVSELEAYLYIRKTGDLTDEEKRSRYPFGVGTYAWITKEAAHWSLENVSHRCFYTKRGVKQ